MCGVFESWLRLRSGHPQTDKSAHSQLTLLSCLSDQMLSRPGAGMQLGRSRCSTLQANCTAASKAHSLRCPAPSQRSRRLTAHICNSVSDTDHSDRPWQVRSPKHVQPLAHNSFPAARRQHVCNASACMVGITMCFIECHVLSGLVLCAGDSTSRCLRSRRKQSCTCSPAHTSTAAAQP